MPKTATKKKSVLRGGKVGSMTALKKSLKRRGGQFIQNIKDEGLLVRFTTEPTEWQEFYEHYDDTREGAPFFPCVEDCEYCADGAKPSKRYLANAVDVDEKKAIIVKLPQTAAEQMVKKYDRFKTILDRDYFLSREGSGRDNTKYDVTPEAPSKMNLSRYEVFDLEAALQSIVDADDDDEIEEKVSKKKSGPVKVAKKRGPVLDEDADDDDDDDEPVRRSSKKPMARKGLAKSKPAPRKVVRKGLSKRK